MKNINFETMKNIKKGDSVLLQDSHIQRKAIVVRDGLDSQDRIRVLPEGIPLEVSVTIHPNSKVYVLHKIIT